MSDIATLVGVVSALVAGLWAGFEYLENQEAERTRYTLALIDDWEKQGYRKAYGNLREAYEAFLATVPPAELRMAETSPTARTNLLGHFNRRIEADAKHRENLREIVYFFNRLNLCVEAAVCSRDTASIFFDDTVRTFLDVFSAYIESNASKLPGGGTSLNNLSHQLNLVR